MGSQKHHLQPPDKNIQAIVLPSDGNSFSPVFGKPNTSAFNSQDSSITVSSDPMFPPVTGDTSPAGNVPSGADCVEGAQDRQNSSSQLHQLSALAAVQNKMSTITGSKRSANGEVKSGFHSSPSRGHSRNPSAISTLSTASTIGELSADLKTRLTYAMMKVHNGWQNHSLTEVESLASQAASPTSSTSTVPRRKNSSASPRTVNSLPSQVHFAPDPVQDRTSKSPPLLSKKPTLLAPPVSIQPSSAMPAPPANPRRNSNPRHTPTLLVHSHSASPKTPGQLSLQSTPRLDSQPRASKSQAKPDIMTFSPHQNVREQDAIETLLFMSSPGNSANLKHGISPAASPGPLGAAARHALPSGPRKALPSQRALQLQKRVGRAGSPSTPNSPMDLDSPQSQRSPRGLFKKQMNGAQPWRSTISMAAALGGGERSRKTLRDDEIEIMLDRASTRTRDEDDSSDGEDIQIPQRNGVSAMSA